MGIGGISIYVYVKVRTQQQQKQAWYIQEVKDIRGVTENSTNIEVGKIPSRRKREREPPRRVLYIYRL